jgi:predicted phosphodiesterase
LNSISFIHLSDIHFTRFSGDAYDLDSDLRNELLRDIQHNAKVNLTNIKGILVCGDIAFSGKSSEYKAASEFLRSICSSLDIAEEAVYCVPGNHDVDQSIPAQSAIIKTIQDSIAAVKTRADIDNILAKYSRDTQYNELLYAPIGCYNNEFAGKFKCYITPRTPTWSSDLELSNNYKLRLLGLNSTVISNADDHAPSLTEERAMVVGQYQIPQRTDNAIYLTLCHHPPECWQDPGRILKNRMDSRIQIQLYGHTHKQTIQKTDKTLIIFSGATHPSRTELDWSPRYNWITMDITTSGATDYLNVKVFPRVLNEEGDHFIPDWDLCQENLFVEYQLSLHESDSKNEATILVRKDDTKKPPLSNNFDSKSLTYGFLSLPYVKRDQIISQLSLGREEDEGLKHVKIMDTLLERAEKQGCIEQFWEKIQKFSK